MRSGVDDYGGGSCECKVYYVGEYILVLERHSIVMFRLGGQCDTTVRFIRGSATSEMKRELLKQVPREVAEILRSEYGEELEKLTPPPD